MSGPREAPANAEKTNDKGERKVSAKLSRISAKPSRISAKPNRITVKRPDGNDFPAGRFCIPALHAAYRTKAGADSVRRFIITMHSHFPQNKRPEMRISFAKCLYLWRLTRHKNIGLHYGKPRSGEREQKEWGTPGRSHRAASCRLAVAAAAPLFSGGRCLRRRPMHCLPHLLLRHLATCMTTNT